MTSPIEPSADFPDQTSSSDLQSDLTTSEEHDGGIRWSRLAVQLLIATAFVALVIYLFSPSAVTPVSAGRQSVCRDQLRQIGLAIQSYQDAYDMLPPAYTVDKIGRPLHSWRTLLLPYLDEQKLYDRIDLTKPWDDPVNAKAAQSIPKVYHCPEQDEPAGHTAYLAIVTRDSALRPATSPTLPQFTDGTSGALLVIEVNHDQSVQWMSPDDAHQSVLYNLTTGEPPHQTGRHALYGDGSCRFLSEGIPAKDLRALITIDAGDLPSEEYR